MKNGSFTDHYQAFSMPLTAMDPALTHLLAEEERRNLKTVNLIASESYCPRSTLEAEASLLVNKNVYGYPGQRGVSGCGIFDEIERLAQQRACQLFDAEHANVQSLASTIANIAVLRALVPAGGTILAFDENAGGHHSHGADYHLSGRDFKIVRFGADEGSRSVDLASVRRLAHEHRPSIIIAGSTSFPYAIDFAPLADIASEVEARLFADIAHVSGLVAAGLLPSPAPIADVVTTSTHKTFCGPRTGGLILCRSEIAEQIDRELFPGLQGAPGAHIIGARAALFHFVRSTAFVSLMRAVKRNAQDLAEALKAEGLKLYLDGTDTHMVVIDLRDRDTDSLTLEQDIERHGLLTNRVALPARNNDRSRAGLRLGTTAMTIRGIDCEGIQSLAEILATLIKRPPGRRGGSTSDRIAELARRHPIPVGFLPAWLHHSQTEFAS